ncbi:COX15/CtaA family protein [Piscinibacter sp.]|jgi:cytochrome c oxidase assembly protein subunit 15|uniref:COX15/CtaA family protein n=1 Tax=Piscinibacter sp. TaxID=1903157 RepID=UPI002F426941
MNAPALYDLTPLARMALLGAALALGPLAWVWLRHRRAEPAARLRALTLLTLFLTFDLVLFGAFTRLTDSGLGCPDWPGCYGNASPLGAHADIHAAQSALPSGPVTHGKAWVEMTHRYLATGVGVLITVLAIVSWLESRKRRAAISPWWATATLVWVCLQGAFGALTVTMKLYPAIVTAHLLGGLALLALLAAQSQAYVRAPLALSRGLHAGAWAVLALSVVQIALGGWVSTNYAVLACSDFPRCQGAWWPPMDFDNGFTLLRALGTDKGGEMLAFAALTAIHFTHRIGALLVFGAIGLLVWRLLASGAPSQRHWALALAAVAAWQFASGLSNVVLGWPLAAAIAHTGGAAALVTVLTVMLARAHQARQRKPAAASARGAAAPLSSAS